VVIFAKKWIKLGFRIRDIEGITAAKTAFAVKRTRLVIT